MNKKTHSKAEIIINAVIVILTVTGVILMLTGKPEEGALQVNDGLHGAGHGLLTLFQCLYESAGRIQLALDIDGGVTLAAAAVLYLVLQHVGVLTAHVALRFSAVL